MKAMVSTSKFKTSEYMKEGVKAEKEFLSDMGKKPTSKHSIDRINNNGNYEPDNPSRNRHNSKGTVLFIK